MKIALIVVVVLVGGLLAVASTRPDSFRYERSEKMHAAPAAVFERIHDFHRWTEWSPYERMDPEMKRTYSGADSGVGASYAWDGTKSGAGRMEIIEESPSSIVRIRLDFEKPMKATNLAEFTIVPEGDDLRVTWAMTGQNDLLSKVFGMFVDVDAMIGKDFEDGLRNLKVAVGG